MLVCNSLFPLLQRQSPTSPCMSDSIRAVEVPRCSDDSLTTTTPWSYRDIAATTRGVPWPDGGTYVGHEVSQHIRHFAPKVAMSAKYGVSVRTASNRQEENEK